MKHLCKVKIILLTWRIHYPLNSCEITTNIVFPSTEIWLKKDIVGTWDVLYFIEQMDNQIAAQVTFLNSSHFFLSFFKRRQKHCLVYIDRVGKKNTKCYLQRASQREARELISFDITNVYASNLRSKMIFCSGIIYGQVKPLFFFLINIHSI